MARWSRCEAGAVPAAEAEVQEHDTGHNMEPLLCVCVDMAHTAHTHTCGGARIVLVCGCPAGVQLILKVLRAVTRYPIHCPLPLRALPS